MTQIIGGDMLSPFYSTALFLPANGVQSFTPLASLGSGTYQIPFCRATPSRKRGLPDTTHSWYPASRGRRQTQQTFDCILELLTNPDDPTDQAFPINFVNGYQMYLTLGILANYPNPGSESQQYFWVPSVFVEEVPYNLDLMKDPVDPVRNALKIRANGPAFFLPEDNTGSPSPISAFITYITALAWSF